MKNIQNIDILISLLDNSFASCVSYDSLNKIAYFKMNYKDVNSTKELFNVMKINSQILKKKDLNFLKLNGYLIIRKNRYLIKNLNY